MYLTKTELSVLVFLSESIGKSFSINEIKNATKNHYSNIYKTLDSLAKKGLVSQTVRIGAKLSKLNLSNSQKIASFIETTKSEKSNLHLSNKIKSMQELTPFFCMIYDTDTKSLTTISETMVPQKTISPEEFIEKLKTRQFRPKNKIAVYGTEYYYSLLIESGVLEDEY